MADARHPCSEPSVAKPLLSESGEGIAVPAVVLEIAVGLPDDSERGPAEVCTVLDPVGGHISDLQIRLGEAEPGEDVSAD
jgi:hypothetical protein